MPKQQIKSLPEALALFIQGAKTNHRGKLFTHNPTTLKGLKIMSQAVEFIDQHSPNHRDILIPLLNDADDEIRITAASALLASRTALALPVVLDIQTNNVEEAWLTASEIIRFKKVFKSYLAGVCTPDPRFPIGHPADGHPDDIEFTDD